MIDSDQYRAAERYAWTRATCFCIARPDVSYDMVEPSSFTDLVEQEGVPVGWSRLPPDFATASTSLAFKVAEAPRRTLPAAGATKPPVPRISQV
jgi:hypothetical protein